MAAILSSGGSAGASPIAVSSGSPASTTAAQGGAGTSLTDMFTQLIAAMTASANAATQQGTAQAATVDLAGFDLNTEGFELTSDDRDADSDDKSDDEEAGALAVAALLPGLVTPAATLPASTASTGAQTGAVEGAFIARKADVDVTEAAVEELTGDSSDGSTQDASTDGTQTPAAANGPTQTTQQVPLHAMLATHAGAAAADTPDATINAPVGSPAWKDELGTQLTWMAINGREAASLKLSPEHLGPLEVRISVREGEASVNFVASSPDTRSAIEQSLPRLRELFASQGMVLTDAGVSRDAPRNAFKPAPDARGSRGNSDASSDTAVKSVTLARAGLIDTYV
jgi:flagellar hook-length control protein FliK